MRSLLTLTSVLFCLPLMGGCGSAPDTAEEASPEAAAAPESTMSAQELTCFLRNATMEEAMDLFPKAMEQETQKVIENFKRMEAQQKKEKSNIIMPGMN